MPRLHSAQNMGIRSAPRLSSSAFTRERGSLKEILDVVEKDSRSLISPPYIKSYVLPAACSDYELSWETEDGGQFTRALLDALSSNLSS